MCMIAGLFQRKGETVCVLRENRPMYLDDCTGLPQRDASVGIFDSGHASIWVELDVGLLLQLAHILEDGVVGKAELFQDDRHLPRV